MVVTDYLLNNINKYVESSSIKVERVEGIFNFCLRSLYDNTSPEEEFRRVYSWIEEKIDVFFKKHSKDKITDKYIIDKYLNLCQTKFEKSDNLITVSRNSDKNDNMFRYFERYQIKYELYFKFLDVISNDLPKNVLLSSYIEEIFVDVLSKIPYF